MAEVYFAATGAYHWLKLFESQMQSQPFFLPAIGPTGQRTNDQFFGMLEPLMLYRFVAPKAGLPIILKTLNYETSDPIIPAALKWTIQKALGLKEPNIKELTGINALPNVKLAVSTEHLKLNVIGIKEDEERVMVENGKRQEAI